MPIASIAIDYEGIIHSPFSGLPADTDDGPNETDPTLLFTYYGDGGSYGFLSLRLANRLPADVDDLEPLDLAEKLQFENLIVLVVNAGWSGVNYYGFAPADDEVDRGPAE
jgi:hypothetical protein